MNEPTYTNETLSIAVATSRSANETLSKLNLSIGGANRKTLNKHIQRLGLDTSHWDYGRRKIVPLEEIIKENSTFKNRQVLKQRLIEAGLFENKCNCCGIGPEWNGQPLVLQLHHKNGNSSDNRPVNLELLCPNCHSQTSTFGGRNILTPKS